VEERRFQRRVRRTREEQGFSPIPTLVIPNGAEGPVRNLLFARVENARVERTLLSAAFDVALDLWVAQRSTAAIVV
jgi:hypothetical protein